MVKPNDAKGKAPTASIEQVKLLLRSGEGARALPLVGDRWVLLILRDAFMGARRFEDFRRLTGAARGTLADRLATLVKAGILYRCPGQDVASRLEYHLTNKGIGFYPVALTLWNWESRWAGDFGLPPRLVHKTCGTVMRPLLACAHCKGTVNPREMTPEVGPGAKVYAHTKLQERRRRNNGEAARGVDTTMFHSVDTLGDRWSVLLLTTLFFGLHRYDDIAEAMGIATNILADRLRRLLGAGVLEQRLYQDRPPRHEYYLTPKGWDLYPATIAIHDWAAIWLTSPAGPGLRLRHNPCGHAWRGVIICDKCGGAVDPHEVGLRSSATWLTKRKGSR